METWKQMEEVHPASTVQQLAFICPKFVPKWQKKLQREVPFTSSWYVKEKILSVASLKGHWCYLLVNFVQSQFVKEAASFSN